MPLFEFVFEALAPGEDLEERLEDDLEAFTLVQDDIAWITLAVEGESGWDAACVALRLLKERGVVVQALDADLVTRNEIAERTGYTRAAVGNWVRGERTTKKTPFPSKFSAAGGGLWMWSEVNAWLRANSLRCDADVLHPTRHDYFAVNNHLANLLADSAHQSEVASWRMEPVSGIKLSSSAVSSSWFPYLGVTFVERELFRSDSVRYV